MQGAEVVGDARDVGQAVDARPGGRDDALDVSGFREIRGDGFDVPQFLQPVPGDVDGDHPPALARDAGGRRPADARRRAGDDHRAALEPPGHDALLPAGGLLRRVGHDAVVRAGDEVVDHVLRQRALAELDQLAQRELPDRGEHALVETALPQQVPQQRTAFRVGQPVADRSLRGEGFRVVRHGVSS